MTTITGRVITVSDRCAAGQRADVSGPLARDLLTGMGVRVDRVAVVPDGIEPVQAAIRDAVSAGCRLVFTTGGTGVSPTDWTPEATEPLLAA
ncbi:MAG: molybdopterin-binding protein, partial [Brooklawnia sp.]|uniref:MogA/MoaB family molybdenum cofactor biosynthesis protein n=1 Tax=Brooklawnia sp. TaxID=2699740 RepID=UPI003C78B158